MSLKQFSLQENISKNCNDAQSYEVPLFDDDHEKGIIRRFCLENMPYDKHSDRKSYHATGYEVLFDGDNIWYTEYKDYETGEYIYGN